MLISLQIENYALIRSLNIRLDNGFTVITGETGAGKSIVIGALSLILGNRADTNVLHDKGKKCFVEGIFTIGNLGMQSFFEEKDLDYQDSTILRREVTENGKSRAFINDTPVNLQTLKELASRLVDIHSQHHNLLFHNADFRLNILDIYAQNQKDITEYKGLLDRFHKSEKKWKELIDIQTKDEQERDFLEYIAQELENANLIRGEQEEMEQQVLFLSNAEVIKTKLFHSLQLLSEQENNILQQLREIKNDCTSISEYNPAIKEFARRLDATGLELKDISFDMAKLENEINVNPAELEKLKERLDLIYFLQQKHHVNTIEELLAKLHDTKAKLNKITDNQLEIAETAAQKEEFYNAAMQKAGAISLKRESVIAPLQKKIIEKLHFVGIPDGKIQIQLKKEAKLLANGINTVDFLFSANKGTEPVEIEKIASGGEMSRLMLVIKSIISDSSLLPTVIFDEIDTGISGEIAGKVANLMKEISKERQLLAITHLPQIAARGELHYLVYKETQNNKTHTNIRKIEGKDRELEIAKMISGEKVTDASLCAAKELIEDYKK